MPLIRCSALTRRKLNRGFCSDSASNGPPAFDVLLNGPPIWNDQALKA